MQNYDRIFDSIEELVMCHSPSGVEAEVDALLMKRFRALGLTPEIDAAGNLFILIPGQGGGALAITAHKDEIGAIVTAIEGKGRIRVQQIGGSFPWIYGEGVVDLLGDVTRISGILSFGSRHVSHASPQFAHKDSAPVRWTDVWIETLLSEEEIAAAGVRIGTRVVVGKHRKAPFRMKDYIASYTLDNKASLSILLALAGRLKSPRPDIYLIASSKEEIGGVGALFFTQRHSIDALIALEIVPISSEYTVELGASPVLLSEDSYGPYDDILNCHLRKAAATRGIDLQTSMVKGFGSDGSITMKAGHVPRAACLGFPTQNTHGYEIAHLGAIDRCIDVLEAVCLDPTVMFSA